MKINNGTHLKLFFQAFSKLIFTVILLSVLLFIPAGTIAYVGGWRFIGLLCGMMCILCILLLLFNPELLRKRLQAREKQIEQKSVVFLSGIMFIGVFVIAGLDFRYGWSNMPSWMIILGCLVLVLSYIGFGEVLRENTFLSRTVEVQQGQHVVSTGLYGIVRHPMYSVISLLYLSVPFVLGSYWALLPIVVYPPLIVTRISAEERLLRSQLQGYEDYTRKVRFRLIPGLW